MLDARAHPPSAAAAPGASGYTPPSHGATGGDRMPHCPEDPGPARADARTGHRTHAPDRSHGTSPTSCGAGQADPVHYIGIDLAWGLKQPTGLAVLDDAGRLVH